MNPRRRSFIRKISYGVAIVLLLVILHWLGRPATIDTQTAKGDPGGLLARQRTEAELNQVYLGKIDPTSETLKLATLGMRGVAANILWLKNIEYQKKKDWTNVTATLNQIVKLQPNFIDVWRHQGWNLSYNCSAEFDDFRERYRWVIKGINFLKLGTTFNRREPRLLRDIGWYISQKIGRADEHKQYRRLFKEDDDFNGARPKSERDNWLVGKIWFRKAEELIDTGEVSNRGINPVVFRSEAPKCQMNYADAIEKEGVFGERARRAWHQSTKDWDGFGQYEMPTSDDQIIRLGDYDKLIKDQKKLLNELDQLAPGVREELYKEKYSQLSDDSREALETPAAKRTSGQQGLVAQAQSFLRIEPYEIARNRKVPRENRDKTKAVLEKILQLGKRIKITRSYRGIVNYDYWEQRAKIEQTDEMLAARELVFQGGKALAEGDFSGAIEAFARGAAYWAHVLNQYPMLLDDSATGDDLEDLLEQYGKALGQHDKLFPPNFALAQYVRAQVQNNPKIYQLRANMIKVAEAEKNDDWATASTLYMKILNSWRQIIEDLPSIEQGSDPATTQTILAIISKYVDVLKKLNQPIPSNFILHRFVRVQMEHDPDTLKALLLMEKADASRQKGDLAAAQKAYEAGFALWRKILDRYPTLIGDRSLGEEWIVTIDEYRDLLNKQKAEMPKDFPLQDVLDRYEQP